MQISPKNLISLNCIFPEEKEEESKLILFFPSSSFPKSFRKARWMNATFTCFPQLRIDHHPSRDFLTFDIFHHPTKLSLPLHFIWRRKENFGIGIASKEKERAGFQSASSVHPTINPKTEWNGILASQKERNKKFRIFAEERRGFIPSFHPTIYGGKERKHNLASSSISTKSTLTHLYTFPPKK